MVVKNFNQSRTRLRYLKVGDIVRCTLGDEWVTVAKIDRTSKKFLRVYDQDGKQIAWAHDGATIWMAPASV